MSGESDLERALRWVHGAACVPHQHDEACVALAGVVAERDALLAAVERVRALDDSICDALCAARQGKYDGMTAAVHLEHLLDRFRAAAEDPA